MSSFPFKHICVIGTSGCGKTTLARRLAKKIDGDHIELDALYHGPNWEATPLEIFNERANARMEGERWVVDGNYWGQLDRLRRADLIIWLDYPLRIILRRAFIRTLRRIITKEELWNGNRESLRKSVSRDGVIRWILRTYWRRRKEFPVLLSSSFLQDIPHLRFYHPREVRRWLASL